jgi:hypothetical protein
MRCVHGNAEEPNASHRGKDWFEQRKAELLEFSSRHDGRVTGSASHNLLEIGIFHFQRHRAPSNVCSLAMSPDPFDDCLERVARSFEREDISGKGVFRTNRLADPAG